MNAVGGTSIHYWDKAGASIPGTSRCEAKRFDAMAPRAFKGSTIEDWLFSLRRLEPFYDKVEYTVGISGKAGNINGKLDERGNIFEAPRNASSHPALRDHGVHGKDGSGGEIPGMASGSGRAAVASKSLKDVRDARITATALVRVVTSMPRVRRR